MAIIRVAVNDIVTPYENEVNNVCKHGVIVNEDIATMLRKRKKSLLSSLSSSSCPLRVMFCH